MLEDLSPAERMVVEAFCRELAFALRRILGATHEQHPTDLAQPVSTDDDGATDGSA